MLSLYFDLNDFDRISAVSDTWDAVARMQNASSLLAQNVIGKSVWPYIAGAGTQDFFADIFAKVRRYRQTVRLPYRCDEPLMRRFFVMDISQLPSGQLRIAHEMVEGSSEEFSVVHLKDSQIEAVCSICLGVKRHNVWHDDYFSPRGDVHRELYAICPTCQHSAQYSWGSAQPAAAHESR